MFVRRRALMPLAGGLLVGRAAGLHASSTVAEPAEAALAGLAFAGDASTLEQRFPLSRRYEQSQAAAGNPVYRQLHRAASRQPGGVRLVDGFDSLQGRDQALAVALVIGSETSSVEQIGAAWRLLTLVRGQVLFFDFKAMAVVRAYPISFGNPAVLAHAPGPDDRWAGIVRLYEGWGGRPGLIDRFANALRDATVPTQATRLLQVTQATLDPSVEALLPPSLRADATTAQTWLADIIGEAWSGGARVPLVPFSKGYAIGNVMPMRVADGRVFQLKLPTPDYEIQVHLARWRRVQVGQTAAGTALVYGSYAQVKLTEPLLGKVYLDAEFKNGAAKRVPASQAATDDFPAYYDSLNGLFVKLAEAIEGGQADWVRSATTSPDIQAQLATTRELMNSCR